MGASPLGDPFAGLGTYELRHLIYHLSETGSTDSIHKLLTLETRDGRNAWYISKEIRCGTDAYVDDVRRAGGIAQAAWLNRLHGSDTSVAFGRSILYTLMSASIVSLMGKVPAGLLPALVTRGVWSEQRAVAYALELGNEMQRFAALVKLAAVLSSSSRAAALGGAFDTAIHGSDYLQINGCIEMMCLPKQPSEIPQLPSEAVRALHLFRVSDDDTPGRGTPWLHYAIRLLPHLSDQTAREIIDGIQQVVSVSSEPFDIVSGSVALIPYTEASERRAMVSSIHELTKLTSWRGSASAGAPAAFSEWLMTSGHATDAIEIARAMTDSQVRSRIVARLGRHAGADGLSKLLALAHELSPQLIAGDDDCPQAYALRGLLPYLMGDAKRSVIERLLHLGKAEDSAVFQMRCFGAAFPHLTGTERNAALRSLTEILGARAREYYDQVADDALADFWPSIDGQEVISVLQAVTTVADTDFSIVTKSRLALYGNLQPTLRLAEKDARSIADSRRRVLALTMLAEQLPEKEKLRIMADVLEILERMRDAQDITNAIGAIASKIPSSQIRSVLEVALSLPSSDHRGGGYNPRHIALSFLIPRVAEAGFAQVAMAITEHLTDADYHGYAVCPLAEALFGISPWISVELLPSALALTGRIGRRSRRAKALAAISVSYAQHGMLGKALEVAHSIDPQLVDAECYYWQFWALARILACRSSTGAAPEIHDEAAAILDIIESPAARAFALAEWVRVVPESIGRSYLNEALHCAVNVRRSNGRVGLLKDLMRSVRILTPDDTRNVLAELVLNSSRRDRSEVLLDLGVLMPVLIAAGGPEMVDEVHAAMISVNQWWP